MFLISLVFAAIVFFASIPFATAQALLDLPETPTPEKGVEQCADTKAYKVLKKTDVQKEGLALWKKNKSSGVYPLPPTLEFKIEFKRGGDTVIKLCKVQQRPSKKWKLIDALDQGADVFD